MTPPASARRWRFEWRRSRRCGRRRNRRGYRSGIRWGAWGNQPARQPPATTTATSILNGLGIRTRWSWQKEVFPTAPVWSSLQAVSTTAGHWTQEPSFMTEERARYYARALAQSILRRAQQR